MTLFYLVRHLPTRWNLKGLIQGRMDIAIETIDSETQRVTEKNSFMLKTKHALVYSSPRLRAVQTAAVYQMEVDQKSALLDELDFGRYEGRPKEELLVVKNGLWYHRPTEIEVGESWEDFEARIRQFIQPFDTSTPVVVFGHGAWIRAAIAIFALKDINKMNTFQIENNEIQELLC